LSTDGEVLTYDPPEQSTNLSDFGIGITQGSDGSFYGIGDEGFEMPALAYKLSLSPALPAPMQLMLSANQVQPGKPVTASLKVLNAFSLTMQQCYAFQNGTPLGKVPGTYNSSTKLYTFSTSFTPATVGIYNYAVTCGGVESGVATLTVGDTTKTTLAAAPNPVTPPANVTLTATVTRTTGSGTPGGSVTFSVGTTVLGKVSVNGSGVATLSASSKGVAAGTYPVVATYSGDSSDVESVSAAVNVTVE
jgi:Bacterial Ig-like domain (group 3)